MLHQTEKENNKTVSTGHLAEILDGTFKAFCVLLHGILCSAHDWEKSQIYLLRKEEINIAHVSKHAGPGINSRAIIHY